MTALPTLADDGVRGTVEVLNSVRARHGRLGGTVWIPSACRALVRFKRCRRYHDWWLFGDHNGCDGKRICLGSGPDEHDIHDQSVTAFRAGTHRVGGPRREVGFTSQFRPWPDRSVPGSLGCFTKLRSEETSGLTSS